MIKDWAAPSIKLQALHKRLDDCLNMKKHSEAFSILLEMQGEVLKLQRFVLYGIGDSNHNNLDGLTGGCSHEWSTLSAQHLDSQAIK